MPMGIFYFTSFTSFFSRERNGESPRYIEYVGEMMAQILIIKTSQAMKFLCDLGTGEIILCVLYLSQRWQKGNGSLECAYANSRNKFI